MLAWRELLDHIGVPWRARGPNTSRDHINIACPWCGDDPSYHLRIAEDKLAFFCLRDRRHSGFSPVKLLCRLGASFKDAQALVRQFNTGSNTETKIKAPPSVGSIEKQWNKFYAVEESDRMLDYLEQRGFPEPILTARRYDLRFAPVGKWAQRILFPFVENNHIVSWSGRSIRKGLEPKYLKNGDEAGLVYIPRLSRKNVVIVEGQFDALKLVVATENSDFSAIALTGQSVDESRILRIAQATVHSSKIFVCLDRDSPLVTSLHIMRMLAQLQPTRYIRRLALPKGSKDVGEMDTKGIRSWLAELS